MPPQQKVNYSGLIAVIVVIFSKLICLSCQDLEQLQLIESAMDHTIDPCEDFNGYACGNWAKHHERDSYSDIGGFLQYNHTLRMMNLIRTQYPAEQLVAKRHQSVIDKTAIYLHSCIKVGSVEVLKYLEEIKPGPGLEWPLIDDMNVGHSQSRNHSQNESSGPWSQFDAFALLGQLHSYGFASDVIEQKTVRVNGNIMTVMTIPDVSDFAADSFKSILADMKLPPEVASRQLEELKKTHVYWQAAYKDYAEFGESENLFSYDDIKQSNPQLNTFLDYVIPPHLREDGSLVVIPYWDYIQFVLSRQWQPYENQKFCNYLMVKFIIYLKQVNSAGCVTTGQQRMHLAYDYLYYKHFYRSQVRKINKDISGLTRHIHKHFLATIYENNLNMSVDQIQAIKEMLGVTAINIGNLPEKFNATVLEKFYRLIPNMAIDNYYANDLKLMKHRVLETVTCPRTISCDEDIGSTPINLYQNDMVVIPFASLRAPLYQTNIDPLLAMSSFGTILGHELAHSADSGTLRSDSIFDTLFEDILEQSNVKEAIACLQRQEATELIDERIADLMGARVAYRAYSGEYDVQPNFTRIPWRRLFFLNLGQIFCAKEEGLGTSGQRLNQIAMNLEAFSEAFQCPVGSKMNPEKKCRFY